MPVEGKSSARFALSAGTSARTSAPLSQRRSSTPFAFACAPSAASLAISLSSAATISLPLRRCCTPFSRQKRQCNHLALDAEPGPGKAGRVIDASVDDFAVTRAHSRPDGVFRLDDDLAASPRQRARDRETDHAGADDEAFDGVHGSLQRVGAATLNNPPAPPVRPAPCRRPT